MQMLQKFKSMLIISNGRLIFSVYQMDCKMYCFHLNLIQVNIDEVDIFYVRSYTILWLKLMQRCSSAIIYLILNIIFVSSDSVCCFELYKSGCSQHQEFHKLEQNCVKFGFCLSILSKYCQ